MYLLRTIDARGPLELHVYRSGTAIGYSGPIGPLPAHMSGQVRSWRAAKTEDFGGEGYEERVRLGFTVRGNEPVLVLEARGSEDERTRLVDLIGLSGPVLINYRRERLQDFTDQVEWSTRVIGLSELAPGWLETWAYVDGRANSEYSDFVAELQARGLSGCS